MESIKEEFSELFRNDNSYNTTISSKDEQMLKSKLNGLDLDRVVAYNLSKGFLMKKCVIFMLTGVRVDDYFYTLLGCEAIEKKGASYIFYYVDTVSTFKLDKDIADYLMKMLEITLRYEQKGHNYAYGNGVEKDIDKALYYYNQIIGLDYNFKQGVFATTAYGYYQRKKYLIANAYCKNAIKYDYDIVYANNLLGMMHHYGLDIPVDLEKALYYYDEGLKIDPHDSNICLQKAQLYLYNMKKYDQVLTVANSAKNPTVLYTVIGTCYSRGYGCDIDINRGNDYLKKAIANNDYRGYHQLTLNAMTLKDNIHILEYLKEYSKHFKDYNNLYGKIYVYGIGVEVDNDKAIDYFEKCLQTNSNDTNALYFLAKIYFEAEEYEIAYEYMEECYNLGSVNCNYFLFIKNLDASVKNIKYI